jgi:hypothetical protein
VRNGSALVALVALALTACGEPEPAGGALPPPSDVTNPVTTDPAPPPSGGDDGPYDPAAEMRPDLMVIEPNPVDAGATVSVTFPEGTSRGVAYVLEVHIDDEYYPTHFLTAAADGYDGEPGWVAVGTEGYGWEDIGIEGPGPDTLIIPGSSLVAGDYRVCTANSLENICAPLTILKDDDSPTPDRSAVAGFVGQPLDEFTASLEPLGYTVRVVERDGESLAVTDDLDPDRIDVAVVTVDGVEQVVRATDDTGVVLGEVTIEPIVANEVPIVAVYDDVDYYIACADVPLEIDGVTWYPVTDWGDGEMASLLEQIVSVDRERPARPIGFAPRVAPPGPGDDIGTVFVYADGFAWFESDSGQSIWLTQEEQTYNWVC